MGGNRRNVVEAGRLPFLARGRSIKNSVSLIFGNFALSILQLLCNEKISEFEARDAEAKPEAKNKCKTSSEATTEAAKMKTREQVENPSTRKKTFTPKKVKIEAKGAKTISKLSSPKFKCRSSTSRKAAKLSLSRLACQDANTPVKLNRFKSLLKSWEESSNKNLTPAVENVPRSSQNVDSQPDKSLQDRNLATGVCSAIGQKTSNFGHHKKINQ